MCIRRDRRAGLYSRRVPQPLLQVRRDRGVAPRVCRHVWAWRLAPFSALIRGIFRDARATHLEAKIDRLQATMGAVEAKLDLVLGVKEIG